MTHPRVTDALRKLRESVVVPPIDAGREQAILRAFDAHWEQPPKNASGWMWRAAAAFLATVSFGLNWLVFTGKPGAPEPAASQAGFDLTGFVPWPGAEVFPPFESGSLVRVDLPVSSLPALGLSTPAPEARVVQADIVIGQDGFARAVRLVQR